MNAENINNTFHSLKEKRESSGLTLKDIFQRTRITVVNLEAIENGDWHLLPVPIYTRNFIKTYARTLGIDSKLILEGYENYLSSLQIVETPSPETLPENITFLDKIVEYKAYIWSTAVLIIVAMLSLLIFSPYQQASNNNNSPTEKIESVDPKKNVDPSSPTTKEAVPVSDQTKNVSQPASNETNKIKTIPAQSNAVRQESASTQPRTSSAQNIGEVTSSKEASLLIIKATEETWIRIQADQNPSYQILLQPGEKFERKAASFEMDIGNAGGIRIQFKGKNIENIGKSGEVIHLRLP